MTSSRLVVTGEIVEKCLAEMSEIFVIGEHGRGYHREIKFHVPTGEYRVYEHHELSLATQDAAAAAEKFNDIRPRH